MGKFFKDVDLFGCLKRIILLLVLLSAPSLTSNAFSQDRSLIIFGKPFPSVPDPEQGVQVTIEDFSVGFATQTYRVLPAWLRPIFGLHFSEYQYTQDGQPAGRRISLYPLSSVGKIDRKDRLAYFDFDDHGRLERYAIFKDPNSWFNLQNIPLNSEASPDERFFFDLLESFSKSPHLLGSAIVPTQPLRAPLGFLSPMIVRPIYDIQRINVTSVQIAMHIARTYSPEGSLQQIAMTLNELPIGSEGQLLTDEVESYLTSLPTIVEGLETSKVFQTALPCRRLLGELQRREGLASSRGSED